MFGAIWKWEMIVCKMTWLWRGVDLSMFHRGFAEEVALRLACGSSESDDPRDEALSQVSAEPSEALSQVSR